jgi:hypothetical protein
LAGNHMPFDRLKRREFVGRQGGVVVARRMVLLGKGFTP